VLNIVFNEKTGSSRNTIDIQGFTITASALGIQPAANAMTTGSTNFQNDVDLDNADEALTMALSTLRSMSSTLGANLSVVQTRQDFTKGMMTTLKTGADNLVLADSNEEGANLLALQTRQQLSQTALSLASQADQSVLKLFG
jgi:flagellin